MLVLILALSPIFLFNSLATADGGFFANYQRDSEGLVVSRVVADSVNSAPAGYGLTFSADPYGELDALDAGTVPTAEQIARFSPYTSQIGVLGYFYSALHAAGLSSLGMLHGAAVLLFVVVLALLTLGLRRVTSPLFTACFVAVLALSPWMVVNVRNLYWSPWTWFLPMLCAVGLTLARTGRTRVLAATATGLAFLIRFAAGFEFLTCFILMAVAVPLLRYAFLGNRAGRLRPAIRDAVVLFAVGIVAFVVDLVILANIRGAGSVVKGLTDIYETDVLRRTYPQLGYSGKLGLPDSSAFTVLDTYIFHGYTNLLGATFGSFFGLSLGGGALGLLIAIAAIVCVTRLVRRETAGARDSMVLLVGAAVPFSWYVLAPSHSAAHPNIVFVLQYLLFVGSLLYIVLAAAIDAGRGLLGAGRRSDIFAIAVRGPRERAADPPRVAGMLTGR